MLCSFRKKINWLEEGLGVASWNYNYVKPMESESLQDVFHKLKHIEIDKRRKSFNRSINLGDVICVGSESWLITSNGFEKIPDIIWQKIIINNKR